MTTPQTDAVPATFAWEYFGFRRADIALAIALAAVAALAVALPSTLYPQLAIVAPIAYFIAGLGDFATAAILLSDRANIPRSKFVLGVSFALGGALTLVAILILPLLPHDPPVIAAGRQSGIWMYVVWHLAAGIGAVAFVRVRSHPSADVGVDGTFARAVMASAVLLFVVGLFVALELSSVLPPLVRGRALDGLVSTGVGPACVALLMFATILMFRSKNAGAVERAYAFSLWALALDNTTFLLNIQRYSLGFYLGRCLLIVSGVVVLIAAIRTLVGAQVRLRETQRALILSEHLSTRRANRIRAIWSVAAAETLTADEQLLALLQVATNHIHGGHEMFGYLSHLDGDEIIVDATAWTTLESALRAGDLFHSTQRLPLLDSIEAMLLAAGRTFAWNALENDRPTVYTSIGWHSAIGTPLFIGRKQFFLIFTSTDIMETDPYVDDDITYIDVVASFFANQVSHLEQFRRIQFQLEHDVLTGLKNRTEFRKAIRAETKMSPAFFIALIDIDGFRYINERDGFLIGDELLVEVAHELASVDHANTVARLGGNEFGVLIVGNGEPVSIADAVAPYRERFTRPFHTGDSAGTRMLTIAASIGIAAFPDHGATIEALLHRAGVALDKAKERGGAKVLVFDSEMEQLLEERKLLLADLKTAISEDQLFLEYQPTWDLETGAIIGAEALVRWNHPQRGRLPPSEFIAFAERNGLIAPLSTWVLERVIADLGSVALPPLFRCYFNLAATLLDELPFIAFLIRSVENARGAGAHIGVEITETTAMRNAERSVETLNVLRNSGIRIAIDDFGTGYSSLSYLKQLTVDLIKIDQSFVAGLPKDLRDVQLCQALLNISRDFEFETLAEGIETHDQMSWLLAHGCKLGQGYFLARPMGFEKMLQLL